MKIYQSFRTAVIVAAPLMLLAASACKKTTAPTSASATTPATAAPACSQQMFGKYMIAGFTAVNTNIITLATAPGMNANVGNTFQTAVVNQGSAKIASFTAKLAAFLVKAYGGPDTYTGLGGRTMQAAHTGLAITSAQYDAFITLCVVPALTNAGVSVADITNCFAPVVTDPTFKASIVGQ